jgi:flagellar motor switch protein FliM
MTRATLSQSEVDALLVAAGSHETSVEPRASGANLQVARYDFRRPDRVSKEPLRSLHVLHDRFAVNLSSSLSAFLRAARGWYRRCTTVRSPGTYGLS